MKLTSLLSNYWLLFSLWLLATSAWQVQSGVENWSSAPRLWHTPKTNIYQRSFYGPKYEAQSSAAAMRLQNDIGNGRNIPRNWNRPKSNLYPSPLYGPRQELQTPAKVVQPKNSYGNRHNIPQNWNTARSNVYQRPFYGPRHEVQTAATAVRLESSFGNKNNLPRDWNVPKTHANPRPFYGSSYKMRKKVSALQLHNGIGNRYNVPRNRNVPRISHYQRPLYFSKYKVHTTAIPVRPPNGIGYGHTVPRKWNAPNVNLNQKPFYGSSYKVGKTTSALQRQNRIGNGRGFSRNWNDLNTNSFHKPFYGPKHKVQTAAMALRYHNSVGNERNVARYWNGPNTNVQRKPLYKANYKFGKTSPPSRLQNGVGNRRNVPRNWIPFRENLYQMPLYGTNRGEEETQSPDGPVIMRSSVENRQLGRSIAPRIAKWLSTVQRNRIPQTEEIRSPVRAFITTPGVDSRTPDFSEPRLPSNYQLEEYAMGQKLEPVPTQSTRDVYNSGDIALQTVLSKVSPSENSLIPERLSNQRATSRTAYIATAREEEQMPVPRKSYVTTSYIRKESRLNDPKLIKLRQILPNLKKRSVNERTDEEENHFNDSMLGAIATRHVSNGTRSLKKRNLENSREKKSSIRKVKGRQIWSILNEFTPNVRLATMTLLKQKRQNVRERELNLFGPKGEKKNWNTASVLNGGLQNVSASAKQIERGKAPLSQTKRNVVLKRHHAKTRVGPKRHVKKNIRNFINGRNNALYVSPSKAYLNRQFSPFYERNFEPYFNTRGQFEAAQMRMAERMRTMRSRGLFHSLGNINPQFFSQNPFRYPAMRMPQQFEAIQPYGLPARNVPFGNSRAPFLRKQNYFGTPWNMRLANRIRETQDKESDNFGIMPPRPYNQGSVQPNMEENVSPETSLQGDSGKFTNGYQIPTTESSRQILKIDDNKLLEGHPMVNSENNDAFDQGEYGKPNPRITGMQVTDQSSAMLNKWYPVRTGKVSLMTDPRKVSSQWPSGLPGLDVATKFNPLQARSYPAVNNPTMANSFYQDNEQYFQPNEAEAEGENANNNPSNWNNIESNNVVFNRGNRIPYQALMMMKRTGMNGIANGGYFPNPGPYPTFPFPFFPSYDSRLVLRKREVRQANNSIQVSHKKNITADAKNISRNLSLKNSGTPANESYRMNKEKNAEKTHFSDTKSHNKRTVIRKHSPRIRKKFRSPRNFVNVGSYRMYANISPLLPFYGDTSDPRMQFMYPQLPVEDPINDMKRKGYKLESGTLRPSFLDLPRRWPNAAAGPLSSTPRNQELAFPVGPPQSLMELSQKVDQFPAQEFTSSDRDISPKTQRQASNVQPNTVSAALNILSSQEPQESSEQPSMRKPRDGRNAENELEQTFVTSPPSYSFPMRGVPQRFQGPPSAGPPEFLEESSSEFPEGTQGIQENELQENGQGLTGVGEPYSQGDESSDNGDEDENGESESVITPGLLDGLDDAQASLLKQHVGNFAPMKGPGMGYFNAVRPYQKGKKRPLPVNRLSPPERQKALLRQNAMAGRKVHGVLQQRATFSTKQNIQGNIQGNMQGNILSGTASGRNSHMLSLPNLSLNTIEKLIDSAGDEQSKGDYNTASVHDYGSSSKSPAGNKVTVGISDAQDSSEQTGTSDWNVHNSLNGNGKFVHNFDWKSPLISQAQSPSDFNWKLERALTEWKEPPNTNHDPANSGGTLPDNPPEKVFVPPKGSNGNPDVVPGYTFDTQGQRSGPLFLPNPPPELVDDTSAETVLMVPSSGDKSKGEAGAKKENISKKVKTSQKENKI